MNYSQYYFIMNRGQHTTFLIVIHIKIEKSIQIYHETGDE